MITESGISRKEINVTITPKHKKHLSTIVQMYNKKLPLKSHIKVFLSSKLKTNVNSDGEDLYKMKIESNDMNAIEDFVNALKRSDISYFK